MKHFLSYILLLGVIASAFSQTDSITVLEEVLVVPTKLKEFSSGQTLTTLSDSLLLQNKPSLTSVLNYNTPIYFKENGLGMVSSPSFRGTTASQTAVLWNGININSRFNGQTDFNTINTGSYDAINVRGGGGSVIYGTGAIGGTVHLTNNVDFKRQFSNKLYLGYGSFDTYDTRYQLKAANKKWSTRVSYSRNQSENDYDYLESDNYNRNGQFYNNSLNAVVGFRANSSNTFKLYSELFEGERHFSLIRASENKTKYQDINLKNLLEWEYSNRKITSITRVAFLKEEYKYFPNIETDSYTFGEANTLIGKYDLSYNFSEKIKLNTILSHEYTDGKGSSIPNNFRNISSGALLLKHQVNSKLAYEAAARKEITQDYESPFLFSFGSGYRFNDYYKLKLNVSKNFRIPTYNDLYWATGGNPDLAAEEALQYELGNEFTYKNLKLTLTGYYNDIDNMIRWLPNSSGYWSPSNVDEVATYGGEAVLNWKKQFNNHQIAINSTYAYTVSKNKETKNQLIYVPYHKATTSVYYAYQKFFVETQALYNGEVFTRSDNNPIYNLNDYFLWNVGLGYQFKPHYTIGGKVRNVLNTAYENVENRQMPGTNYTIYLTLNF
ncbi:iron complex outermembrane recepter protein [Mesonia phycicola]|uniref:Iron complex outermembrane recepter protein n=1 Tax=Mesonia phycicola TaxID=579105 RepID=A0A1M6BQY6_9FLAO|nr:TonB-dependent receptor [Mesonia phycicola]SHI51139.1 iron complex outermembrane recepter protein [Mesonia phycicola]